jgi:hypothetical protein
MMARAFLFAALLGLAAFSLAPAASAAPAAPALQPSCIVGNDPSACLVSIETRVCVTEPCDEVDVCVLYGRVCPY